MSVDVEHVLRLLEELLRADRDRGRGGLANGIRASSPGCHGPLPSVYSTPFGGRLAKSSSTTPSRSPPRATASGSPPSTVEAAAQQDEARRQQPHALAGERQAARGVADRPGRDAAQRGRASPATARRRTAAAARSRCRRPRRRSRIRGAVDPGEHGVGLGAQRVELGGRRRVAVHVGARSGRPSRRRPTRTSSRPPATVPTRSPTSRRRRPRPRRPVGRRGERARRADERQPRLLGSSSTWTRGRPRGGSPRTAPRGSRRRGSPRWPRPARATAPRLARERGCAATTRREHGHRLGGDRAAGAVAERHEHRAARGPRAARRRRARRRAAASCSSRCRCRRYASVAIISAGELRRTGHPRPRPAQALRRPSRPCAGIDFEVAPRRGVRPARAQRRGQDDDRRDPRGLPRRGRAASSRCSATTRSSARTSCASASGSCCRARGMYRHIDGARGARALGRASTRARATSTRSIALAGLREKARRARAHAVAAASCAGWTSRSRSSATPS